MEVRDNLTSRFEKHQNYQKCFSVQIIIYKIIQGIPGGKGIISPGNS